eukprot:Seg708.14 transcript_id=Seg708.14/GoldUCD/mRNA.D3Y31 product="hypothetical protein" protein_id=Seg708.14/GoldUCD/D3Y31
MICSDCLLTGHKGHCITSAKEAKNWVEDDAMAYLRSKIIVNRGFPGALDTALHGELQKVEDKKKTMAEEIIGRKAKILSLVISTLDKAEEMMFEAAKSRITETIKNKKRETTSEQQKLTALNRSIAEYKAEMNDIDFLAKMIHLKASMSEEDVSEDLRDKLDFNFKLDLTDMNITDEIISLLLTSLGDVSLSSSKGTEIVRGKIAQASIRKIRQQDGSQLRDQLCTLGLIQRDTSTSQAQGGQQRNRPPMGAGIFTISSSTTSSNQHNGAKPRQNSNNGGWASQNASGRNQASNYSPMPVLRTQLNSNQGMGYNNAGTGYVLGYGNANNSSTANIQRCVGYGYGCGQGNRSNGYESSEQSYSSSCESSEEEDLRTRIYCFRCLRHGHEYKECYSVKDSKGQKIKGSGFKNRCFRCGRSNHIVPECRARIDAHGFTL